MQNLSGWLTTVVAHVCLDMLRSRTSRREESMESQAAGPVAHHAAAMDPEQETLLAESVGLALLVVLDTLGRRSGWRLCCTTCSMCHLRRLRRLLGGLPRVSQIEVITEQSRLKQLNLAILTG